MSVANVLQGADNFVINDSMINNANVINIHSAGQMATNAPSPPLKPNASLLFTGRADVLQKLKTYFSARPDGGANSVRRLFLLHGMGGIGKTQICLKFTEEMVNSFSRIFWVDASSDETISLSLKGYGNNPQAKASGVDGSLQSILNWMGSLKEEWLLIFDNADHYEPSVVQKYILPGQTGNILITSRNSSLRRLTTVKNSLELNKMEENDAIALLFKAAFIEDPSDSDWEFARNIVNELCYLPLAVDQAGSAIESGLCGIDSYLKLYSSQRKDLLSDSYFRGASSYERTVYGTWELSFKQIEAMAFKGSEAAKSAINVLQIFAFCHHSNIKEEIFEKAAVNAFGWDPNCNDNNRLPQIRNFLDQSLLALDKQGCWNSYLFKQGVRILLSFALIKHNASNMDYFVHPLVHAWSRERFSSQEQLMIYSKASAILTLSISAQSNALNDIQYRQQLSPHIIFNYNVSAQMGIPDDYYDDKYSSFRLVFFEIGHMNVAEMLAVQVFEMHKRVLGEECLQTINSRTSLATIYFHQGRWKEAEKLHVQSLEQSKQLCGENCQLTLAIMENLASTFRSQGRCNEAEKLQVKVLEKRLGLLPEENYLNILASLANLSHTYCCQERWTEAEELQVSVVMESKILLGDEHPMTLTRMANLATIYQDQGKITEADGLLTHVLEISKRTLGEEHPSTLTRMANLASSYQDQAKAEKEQVQILEISKRLLGEKNPFVLTSKANLASTYQMQGRWAEAEEILVHVVEMSKEVKGEEHPETLACIRKLAYNYCDQGRWTEAEELGMQALRISKKLFGEEHQSTINKMSDLAVTYWSQGRYNEAEKLQVQILEMEKKSHGDNLHPDKLGEMSNLASTYWSQGKLREAEELEIQVLETSRRLFGEEHLRTLTSMANLASTYHKQGKWTEAEMLQVSALGMSKRLLREEHSKTWDRIGNMATIYWNLGKWAEAEKLDIEVLELSKKVLGKRHPETLARMAHLAYNYQHQGKWTVAEGLLDEVVAMSKEVNGDEHPQTLAYIKNLEYIIALYARIIKLYKLTKINQDSALSYILLQPRQSNHVPRTRIRGISCFV